MKYIIYAIDEHTVEKMKQKVKEDDELFFIGGLWSQFKYMKKVLELPPCYKYLSIHTSILPISRTEPGKVELFDVIMKKYIEDNNSDDFLTTHNIKNMLDKGYILTGYTHSAWHTKYFSKVDFTDKQGSFYNIYSEDFIKKDLDTMLDILRTTFNTVPNVYVYPYSERSFRLDKVLKSYKIFTKYVLPNINII
jgi:hypothetical protein